MDHLQSDEVELAADIMSLLADLVYCSVCACMQTQHKIQLDVRDSRPDIVMGTPFPPDLAPELMPTFTGHPGLQQQGQPATGIPVTDTSGAAGQPEWSKPPPGYPTS